MRPRRASWPRLFGRQCRRLRSEDAGAGTLFVLTADRRVHPHHGRGESWSATSRKVATHVVLPTPQSRPRRTMTASASGAT
jgi:hypothetical protein